MSLKRFVSKMTEDVLAGKDITEQVTKVVEGAFEVDDVEEAKKAHNDLLKGLQDIYSLKNVASFDDGVEFEFDGGTYTIQVDIDSDSGKPLIYVSDVYVNGRGPDPMDTAVSNLTNDGVDFQSVDEILVLIQNAVDESRREMEQYETDERDKEALSLFYDGVRKAWDKQDTFPDFDSEGWEFSFPLSLYGKEGKEESFTFTVGFQYDEDGITLWNNTKDPKPPVYDEFLYLFEAYILGKSKKADHFYLRMKDYRNDLEGMGEVFAEHALSAAEEVDRNNRPDEDEEGDE